MKYEVIIIGGGAAGLMAAAKLKNKNVLILEGAQRVGKKLLSTGAGRCNLSNSKISPECFRGDTSFLREFLGVYSYERIKEEFLKMGLLIREDNEGRAYPYSMQATTVLDILRKESEKAETICECEITDIKKIKDGFKAVSKDGRSFEGKNVIISCGGKASNQLASKTGGYLLAEKMGHTVKNLKPSLVPVLVNPNEVKALKGIRARAKVTLLDNGKAIAEDIGEVQFADGALSGICVFNISRFAKKGMKISLDLMPEYSNLEIEKMIKEDVASEIFLGALNKRVYAQAFKEKGFSLNEKISPKDAAFCVKNFEFNVLGTQGLDKAQVTAGGVSISEIDTKTMQSEKAEGLYFCGEILDIDGLCGGFNLHFAWSSAIAASEDIIRRK